MPLIVTHNGRPVTIDDLAFANFVEVETLCESETVSLFLDPRAVTSFHKNLFRPLELTDVYHSGVRSVIVASVEDFLELMLACRGVVDA